jgi:hypothetical protein
LNINEHSVLEAMNSPANQVILGRGLAKEIKEVK